MASLSLRKVYCCGSVLPTRLTAILQARSYEKKYSRLKEDVVAYSKFKKELSATRLVFQKELRSQKEMSMEEFNSQAAEEARMARETEAAALEANKIELERMALKRSVILMYENGEWMLTGMVYFCREHAIERAEKKRDEKFLRGMIAKEAWEKKRMKQREREVAQVQVNTHYCVVLILILFFADAQFVLLYNRLHNGTFCCTTGLPVAQQELKLFC